MGESYKPPDVQLPADCWFDDACILDMDYFVKNLSIIKAKGFRPELIGSIITHYASKWLPDLATSEEAEKSFAAANYEESPESATASWMKKRFFVETLVGVLPPERDSIACSFLLRLLRVANMVGAELAYRAELEKRISWQLDQASLDDLIIPSFSHTCGTLLDVGLVLRLVKRFVSLDEAVKGGAALVKVAKLVDCYLSEAATDSNLGSPEFIALAGALPAHARSTDDGLYRAIDIYLQVHPGLSKQERKSLCRLMNSQKLSSEASIHATQNERLPVRAVIRVLLSEQSKLSRQFDWSGSFSRTRSPTVGFEQPGRCLSKREVTVQQLEIKRLREDVVRLESRCIAMQRQMERLMDKKRSGISFFSWKKLGMSALRSGGGGAAEKGTDGESVQQTPMDGKKTKPASRGRTPSWRDSLS